MSNLKLLNKSTELLVEPSNGGRIAQLKINEIPVLFEKEETSDVYGSTWWPSPQNKWNWPPPSVINNGAYSVLELSNKRAILQSGVCEASLIQIEKIYELKDSGHLQVTYTAKNISNQIIQLSHWENTRLPKGGKVLFPVVKFKALKEKLSLPDYCYLDPSFNGDAVYNEGLNSVDFTIPASMMSVLNGRKKLFTLSKSGWSSYINNGVLFIKVFPIIKESDLAPEQGNIELYISELQPYIELEQQGSYETIKPSDKTTYTSHWLFTTDFPKDLSSAELIDFIEPYIKAFNLR